MDFVPFGSLVYFHNLSYDINFLSPYIRRGMKNNNQWIMAHTGKFELRDSYRMISAPLSSFGKMFGLKVHKELFPYELYNVDDIPDMVSLEEFTRSLRPETDETLLRLLREANALTNGYVDMWAYAKFYCNADVIVLRDGFKVFMEGIKELTGRSAFDFYTISSISAYLIDREGDELAQVSGLTRAYIQRSVYGGRVMPALPHGVGDHREEMLDMDAVSLYASAIVRLCEQPLPTGVPTPVQGSDRVFTSYDDVVTYIGSTAFIVDIEVIHVGKELASPLLVQRGVGKQTNVNEPVSMTVDDIYLKAIFKYHAPSVVIKQGLRWTEFTKTSHTRIADMIKHLFNKRKELKSAGNPLEVVYKLCLNSVYGKTIQKPVETNLRFVTNGEELDKYMIKNYHKIRLVTSVEGSDRSIVMTSKQVCKHWNNALLGTRILSMSKLIMQEAMARLDRHEMFYTDTDSLFILRSAEHKLAPLIGNNLGQFHSDLPPGEFITRAIFVGKKMYALLTNTGRSVIRMKGIPEKSVRALGPVMNTYERLLKGETLEFDLLVDGQVSFDRSRSLVVSSRTSFIRKISMK